MSILLHGTECWTPLRKGLKRLDFFHHRCICSTLVITNQQQWDNHITSQSTRQQWGDMETVSDKVSNRHLEWLGHLAQMPDKCTPKICLFSWSPEPHPQGGPLKRWRDVIRIGGRTCKSRRHMVCKRNAATSKLHYGTACMVIKDSTGCIQGCHSWQHRYVHQSVISWHSINRPFLFASKHTHTTTTHPHT